MNIFLSSILLTIFFSFSLQAQIPHMDLEMTGKEYQRLLLEKRIQGDLKIRINKSGIVDTSEMGEELAIVEKLGVKNLEWIAHINKFRDPDKQLSFTVKFVTSGIPITNPKKYSPSIILNDYNKLLETLPAEMKSVLVDGKPLTKELPLDEASYIQWGRKVDGLYSTAIRWKTMEPYLFWLGIRKENDLRGYYYISKTPDFRASLATFASLPAETQENYKQWLAGICFNALKNSSSCKSEIQKAIASSKLQEIYDRFYANSEKLWNSYFNLNVKRPDVVMTSGEEEKMSMPFLKPKSQEILDFVKINVEEEWKLGPWKLLLDIKETNADVPRIVFKPGVTPNVNGLGGNVITMDSNTPLTEQTLHWVIRHEFGHVIGFTDCYIEFYDEDEGLIMNYQLDTSDLMCSRAGRLKPSHLEQLKSVYN